MMQIHTGRQFFQRRRGAGNVAVGERLASGHQADAQHPAAVSAGG